jgi:hypothetical protein
MRLFGLLSLPAILAACSSGSSGPVAAPASDQTAVVRADLGVPFEMKVGDVVEVTGTGLRLRFNAVENDSRCPISPFIVCVWMGDAQIALTVDRGTRTTPIALHTTTPPRSTKFDEFEIELNAVLPARTTIDPIPQASYRSRLTVSSR